MKEDFDPAYPKVLFLVCKWYDKVEEVAHRMVSLYPLHCMLVASSLRLVAGLSLCLPACLGGGWSCGHPLPCLGRAVVSRARPSRKTEGSGVTAIRDSFLSPRFTGNHTSHVLLMARVWLDSSTRIWRALARAYLHFCAHHLLIIHVPIIAFLQNELRIAVTPDPSVFLEGLARKTRES